VSSVKRYLRPFLGLCSTLFLTLPLSAHPGHGEGGAAHYLVTPEHVLPVLVAFALLVLVLGTAFRGRITKSIAKR
jgi:hypothetical protein